MCEGHWKRPTGTHWSAHKSYLLRVQGPCLQGLVKAQGTLIQMPVHGVGNSSSTSKNQMQNTVRTELGALICGSEHSVGATWGTVVAPCRRLLQQRGEAGTQRWALSSGTQGHAGRLLQETLCVLDWAIMEHAGQGLNGQ